MFSSLQNSSGIPLNYKPLSISLNSNSLYNVSPNPNESNPGPIFADVAGTLTLIIMLKTPMH